MAPTSREIAQQRARKLLRLFLNDTPELNRLIRTHESTEEKLDLCLQLAIDDFNSTSPLLSIWTIETFPSLWILLYGAAIQALRSSGLLQSRNELTYSSGGVSVRIFDKTQLYQSWINQFQAEYKAKVQNYKISINIAGALAGGVRSEYWTLASYY